MASLVTTTVAGTLTATSTTQPVVKAAYNANHYLGIGHHYIDLNYTTYTNDLELRTGGTARLTINRSTGAATFSGNVTLNSSLTFSYNNYYFEAGTGSIYLKNASGNTVLGMKDAELVVPGVATFNGYIELDAGLKDKDGSFGTNGYVLTTDGSGDVTWAASPGAGSVTGTGTNNYIASWNGTTALETANIYKHAYGTIINSNFLSSYATNRHVFEVAGNPGTGDFDGGIINLRVASNTNNERVGQLAFINSANANHVNPNSTIGSRIAQIISTVATSDSNAGDDSGGDLQFWTKPEAGVPAERMRISSAGLFGIGSDPMANSRLRIAGETYPLRVATGSTEYYFAANVLYANSTNGMYLVNQSSYLRFGASNAEIMRLVGTGNGSVGIGTTSPGGVSKLEVQRNPARTTAFNAGDGDTWHDVIVRNPTNSSNAASGITFVMNNTYHKNAGAGIAAISGGSDYMASLAFITRPNGAVAAERMRIQYDGKVGINTNSPIKSLDVRWSSSDTTVATGNGLSGGNAGEGMLLLNTYNGTGIYANLDFRAYDADARIAVERTSSGNQSNMHFITDNSSNFDTRMFIQYDGNVGIGATSPQTDLQIGDYTDAAETITIATSQNGTGRINFYDNNNTEGGSIRVTGETSGSKMHFANRWTNDSTEITFDLVNGRVGIGSDAPGTKLEIIQNGAFASGQSVALQIASALQAFGGNNDMRLYFHEAGTTYRGMMGYAHAGSTYMGIWDNSSNLNPTLVCQSGEVGIGTTAPGKKLHVYSGASGVGASSDVNMILEGASNVGLAMLAPNNQGSRIEFGSVADNNEGIIYYNNTGSYFSIYTNGTRQVDITSAGNVGIGQAAPRNPLEVDLNQSNGTLTGDSAAHFGGQHHTSGEIMGLTLGYREANDNYRKVGIVAEGLGDGAARQNFHILVNTANSAASCSLADKKLSIYGTTGIIRVHNKFGIGGDPGAHHLYAAGSAFITGSVGIGTATPAEKLDVNGNIMTTGASTNTGYDRYLKLYGNTQPASNPHRWAGMAVYNNGGNNVNALAFFTGTGDSARTEKVRIHNDGKVGIGSTTPIRQLDVLGAVAGQYSAALINTSATGHGLYIKAAPNNASYMALAVDDKDGATILVARADKRVGVGLNAPIAPIHTCLGPVANTANTIVAYFGGGSSGNQYGSFIARVARSSSTSNVGVTNNESYVDIEVNSGGSGPFRWGTYDDVNIVTGAHGGSTGAYGNLNFVTGTGSNTKAIAMTIGGGTQGGKVGIGTTEPSAKLHAILDSAATNTPTDVLRLGHTSTGNTAVGFGALIRFDAERTGSTTDGMGRLGFVADTMTSSRVDGAFIVQTGLDGSYTERLRIHSNGKMETNGSSGYGYVMHRVNGTLMGYVGDGGSLSVSPTNATTDFVMRAVGKLAFLTNNSTTAKMTILADGKVGIGSTNPSTILSLGGSLATGGIYINSGADEDHTIIDMTGITGGGKLIWDDSEEAFSMSKGLRVTAGSVGIGTYSPDNPLEVVGADSGIKISAALSNRPQLRLECGTTEKMIFSANSLYGAIGDSSDLNRYMAFKDGKVGIGETSPGYKLTVNGDFKVESDATFDGSVYVRNANNNAILLGKGTRWGYSTAYRAVQIGDASGNHTVCIGYDPAGNSASSFTGDGREMLFRNGITFVTPNAGNTNWHHTLTLKDGLVGIGDTSPDYKLDVDGTFGAAGAATFGGSVTANSTLSVGDDFTAVGNCQLGNSYSDSHTVYGQTTFLEEGLNPEPDIIYLRNTTNGGKASIRFGDHATQGQSGYFRYAHSDSHSNGTGNSFHFDSSETSTAVIIDQTTGDSGFYVGDGTTLGNTNYMVALRGNNDSYLMGGDVGIGTRSPSRKFEVYDGNARIFQQTATAELLIGSGATGAAALILDASNGDGAGADYFYIQQLNDLTTDIGTAVSGGVVKLRSKGSLTQTLDGTKTTFNGIVVLGNVQSSINPLTDSTYDIGSNTGRWANVFADTLYGAGSNITALNGSNISSGQVAAARLGSGSSIESKFLRGDNTWQTVSSGGGSGTVTEVTVGTGLDVSNGTTTPNITLDLAELSTAGSVTGTDDFVVIDGSSTRKEQMNTIGLSGFSGYYGLINRIGKGSADSNTYVTPNSSGRLGFAEGTGVSLTFGSNLITFATGTSSDYRLKKNISTFNSDAWAKVKSVNLRKFDFDEDAFKTAIDSPDPEIVGVPKSYTDNVGFIAHELAEVRIDGAVIGEKDAVDSDGNLLYQKVNYNALVPVLWGALNEAISKIETLESKVQALEDK